MIKVSEGFKNAVMTGTVKNEITILVFDTEPYRIGNSEIVTESMKLTQSLCDEDKFKFGGCIASQFEIEITKNVNLTGKYITVSLKQTATAPLYPSLETYPGAKTYPGYGVYENELAIFSGEVYSCKLNKDRIIRKLVAYDRFYWRGQIDCTNWYRSLFDSGESIPTIKLGQLRLAILKNFKIIQEQTLNYEELVPLPADNIDVYRISDNVTVGELLRQICEINGCFMYFNGKGNVEYILVNDDKHTHENTENYGHYIDIETEDFEKTAFDGIYITGFENKGKGIFDFDGSAQENLYFMEENRVITAGYKPQEFNMEFFKCRNSIEPNYKISYTPLRLKSEYRCWVELGDRITVEILWYDLDGIKQQIKLKSLVLSRSLSGIQAITDEISAGGEKVRYTEEYFASTKEDGD